MRRAPAKLPTALACAALLAFGSLSRPALAENGQDSENGRHGGTSAGAPLTSAEIRAAQRRLAELGFWTGPADGKWDVASRQALVAFQKAEWRKPTGRLSRAEYREVLRGFAPAPREKGEVHVEVDLARQILFLVDAEGKVSHVLPISSGSGRAFRAPGWQATADTPCGHFAVFAKLYGWQHSPLGEMHNPMFIVGGIAIHGSESVPARPVSHGCIRIPMFASATLTKIVPRNTPVVVYGCKDEDPPPVVAAAGAAHAAAAAPVH
jgi:N-acetylmuramoyl-L-alanine amidase